MKITAARKKGCCFILPAPERFTGCACITQEGLHHCLREGFKPRDIPLGYLSQFQRRASPTFIAFTKPSSFNFNISLVGPVITTPKIFTPFLFT